MVVQQQAAQVVPVTSTHVHDFAQRPASYQTGHGHDIAHEKRVLHWVDFASGSLRQFQQGAVLVHIKSSFDFQSYIGAVFYATHGMFYVALPGGGHEH